jgi:outer membrane protein OmpA-like peptidoglycan-associated protein
MSALSVTSVVRVGWRGVAGLTTPTQVRTDATDGADRADPASGFRLARAAQPCGIKSTDLFWLPSPPGCAETGARSEPIRSIRDIRRIRPTLRLWGLLNMIPRTALILAALGVTACAPQRPAPGALAPVERRGTNEARSADLAAIDAWEARRVALVRNDGPDLAARTVALARAGAWLVFAREAYQSRPMTSEADDALAEARKLMAPFAADARADAGRGALAAGADRMSPDNWAEVERLASKPEAIADVASLAEAEIELVRAAQRPRMLAPGVMLAGGVRDPLSSAVVLPATISESSLSALSCPAVQHIARAVALLGEADVVLQGEARQLAVVEKLQQDDRVRARRVHFALKSDAVGMPSAALLAGVAGALKSHPELSLVIEGHADPRGGGEENRELSGRRGAMVRQILADSGVTEDRMLVRQFGETRRAAAGTTAVDYARDRRVVLKFVLPNGEELPIAEDTALDLQVERVVKRSAPPRGRPPVRRTRVPR